MEVNVLGLDPVDLCLGVREAPEYLPGIGGGTRWYIRLVDHGEDVVQAPAWLRRCDFDAELRCDDASSRDPLGAKVRDADGKTQKLGLQCVEITTGVEQSPDGHVAGSACEAIEVCRLHRCAFP
jgi:hypothetical protein